MKDTQMDVRVEREHVKYSLYTYKHNELYMTGYLFWYSIEKIVLFIVCDMIYLKDAQSWLTDIRIKVKLISQVTLISKAFRTKPKYKMWHLEMACLDLLMYV